jgi:hypothetical protein
MRASEFINEISRRGFLKGLGAAAMTGATTGISFASGRSIWTGNEIIPNTPDRYAKYYLTSVEKKSDGKLIVKSRREGSSGVSTTVRILDCDSRTWKYIETDGVKTDGPMTGLVPGSSATATLIAACLKGKFLSTPAKKETPAKQSTQPTKPEPESTNPVAQQIPEPVSQVKEPGERSDPNVYRVKLKGAFGQNFYVAEYDPQTFKATEISRQQSGAKPMNSDTAKKVQATNDGYNWVAGLTNPPSLSSEVEALSSPGN